MGHAPAPTLEAGGLDVGDCFRLKRDPVTVHRLTSKTQTHVLCEAGCRYHVQVLVFRVPATESDGA